MKNLFIFHTKPKLPFGLKRFREEAPAFNLKLVDIVTGNLIITVDQGGWKLLYKGQELNFRNSYSIIRGLKYQEVQDYFLASTINNAVSSNGSIVLNGDCIKLISNMDDKLLNYHFLLQKGLPIIETLNFRSLNQLTSYSSWSFPVLVKPRYLTHGSNITVINNKEELIGWIENQQELEIFEYIWQPYINGGFDLRIFAGPQKIYGAMKRQNSNSFIHNVSAGATGSNYKPNKKIEDICLKVAQTIRADFTGIDIIIDPKNNQPLILEYDRTNQFKGFEEATGVNVAKTQLTILTGKNN